MRLDASRPYVIASPTSKAPRPKLVVRALLEKAVMISMRIGTAMFRIRVRPLRSNTVKSARKSERKMSPVCGRAAEIVSVTDLTPRQTDEDVLQGHLAVCDREH